jgi:hypothetical protein
LEQAVISATDVVNSLKIWVEGGIGECPVGVMTDILLQRWARRNTERLWVASKFQTHVRRVLGWNLSWDTGYLQANSR